MLAKKRIIVSNVRGLRLFRGAYFGYPDESHRIAVRGLSAVRDSRFSFRLALQVKKATQCLLSD